MYDYWRFTPRGCGPCSSAAGLEVERSAPGEIESAWSATSELVRATAAGTRCATSRIFPVQVWAFCEAPGRLAFLASPSFAATARPAASAVAEPDTEALFAEIEELSARNRQSRDAGVERRIRALRHEAGGAAGRPRGRGRRTTRSPTTTGSPPGSGIPEVTLNCSPRSCCGRRCCATAPCWSAGP